MKSLRTTNKKWILTASLFAALSANYALQYSPSKMLSGAFDFSSQAVQIQTEAATNDSAACNTDECSSAPAEMTQIKTADLQALIARLDALEKKLLPTAEESKPVASEKKLTEIEEECGTAEANESSSDKKTRLKCEKETKEKIKLEAKIEKFEEKMEKIKDKCDQDLECLSSEFASAVSRYEGKNALPSATINKAFKSVVGTTLVKALYSDDETALTGSISALQALMQELPSEYKTLKQGIMEIVKMQTTAAAQKVSESYAQLNQLAKQNNSAAYLEAAQNVKLEHNNLIYLANSYSSAIQESVSLSEDLSAISYYQKNYLPNVQKIMAGVYGSTSTKSTTTNISIDSRTQRNGDSTTAPQTIYENPINNPNNNGMIQATTPWNFPATNQLNGFSNGSISNQSMGGRGSRQ